MTTHRLLTKFSPIINMESAGPLRLLVQLASEAQIRHCHQYQKSIPKMFLRPRRSFLLIKQQVTIQAADPLRLLPRDTKPMVRLPHLRQRQAADPLRLLPRKMHPPPLRLNRNRKTKTLWPPP